MFYVYILRSEKDGNLYAGYTTDLHQRMEAHTSGSVASTQSRRPLKLIFTEAFIHKYDALRREKYFKTNEGKKMLKFILRETLAKDHQLNRSAEEELRCDFHGFKKKMACV